VNDTVLHRRRYLRSVGLVAGVVGFAGCSDGGTDSGTPEPDSPTPIQPASTTPDTDELDLREANIVGVSVEASDGSYRFSVTLHHDDDGEPGYANWWQVEALDGTQLGRRVLAHPHSQQPFTRSATIEVPGGIACVVVRGHDETHGYGGRAMLVDLETGGTRAVDQGTERTAFDERDCPG
jgi:hypothetical protein